MKIKFQIKNQYDKYLDKLFKNITSNSYIWRVDYDEVFRGDYSFLFNKSEYNDIEFHKIIEQEDYYIVQLQLQLFDDNKLLLEMKVVDNIFVEINVYDENNNIVYNGKSDSEGKITIEKLAYGKYYIKQIKVPSGYILNEEIVYFSVNDMSCLSDIKVTNEKSIMPVTSSSSNILLNIFPFAIIGILFVIKKIMQN